MPCNSDYMEATRKEIELSRVACFLGEINGVKWREEDWDGYHPKIYSKHVTKEEADKMVAQLCEFLQHHDVTQFSLEMQMWWRDHQKADKERLEHEMEENKTKQEKENALSKLTQYEKDLLGFS